MSNILEQNALMSDNSRQTDRQISLQIINWVRGDGTPPSAKLCRYCSPICAREAKGFNNWGQTGILTIRKL